MPHDHGHSHAGHGHAHGHDHGDRNLTLAVIVNLVLTVAQVVGGVLSGSMALIADAIHNLSDALSLVVAFAARRIARRPSDETMTFGYARAEPVAALVNYTSLILIALWLAVEAVLRLLHPPEVQGWTVVILAGIALVIDAATAALTWRMAKDSQNIRAAFLHNVADALSSVAVMVGGTLILLYDWRLVDPVVTMLISGYILWHAGRELAPVIRVLMLGAPGDPGTDAVRASIGRVEGVEGLHHLHVWQIDERRCSVEAHVEVRDLSEFPAVARRIKAALAEEFGIRHSTLEAETRASGCAGARAAG